jgi:hypothetical protein
MPQSLPRPSGFHPYHPRNTRLVLLLAMLVALAMLGWALWDVRRGQGAMAWMRALGAVLLLGGFGTLWWRLRPREGWGARVTSAGLTLSRPFGGGSLELDWDDVRGITREGKRREVVVIHLPEGEWRLEGRMFQSHRDFEAAVDALEEHLPRRAYDA